MSRLITRRNVLLSAGAVGGGLTAANWGALSDQGSFSSLLRAGDVMNMHLQRIGLFNRPLAKEYQRHQITANHPVTGGIGSALADANPAYEALRAQQFRDWRLQVKGLVDRPSGFSLEQLRAMPSRSQITMHSCDEGWSAIGEWTGVPLGYLLAQVGIKPEARYVVMRCLDSMFGQQWWGSIDLLDAMHPQTILAYGMNGAPLPVGHGAPLRLRIELQIGYKNLKHLSEIELVDSLRTVGDGKGGISETYGYQWYAGQ